MARTKLKNLYCLILISTFCLRLAYAASCCGSALAFPSIISGDEAGVMGVSTSAERQVHQVDSDGIWYRQPDPQTTQGLKFDAAKIFNDRWQIGASIPLRLPTENKSSNIRWGDSSAILGYEFLPDWDYNPWRPKGIGFLKLGIPLQSRSSNSLQNIDRGQWSIGLGSLFTKNIESWDINLSLLLSEFFPVNRKYQSISYRQSSNQAYFVGIGGGYNTSGWRLGTSLDLQYENGFNTSIAAKSASKRSISQAFSLSKLIDRNYLISMTYFDQNLWGRPSNVALNRGISLFFQKKWPR